MITTVEGELEPRHQRPRSSVAAWVPAGIAWLVVAGCGLAVLDHLGRGTTFFYDEWNFVLERRSGWGDALWAPHNGHLSALPVLVYRLMLSIFGLDNYHAYRLMGLAVHFVVATLVVVIVGKRCAPLIGVAAGAVVLLLGAGWQNIFWPFQIGFMGSVAFFLAAWVLLDAGSRRNDVLAAACLVGALACSGLGIAAVVGCTVRLAMRRTSWPRWWVVTVPAVLYLAWYLGYGVSQASSSNIDQVPSYLWSSLGGAFGAVAGRGPGAGQIAGIAVALFVIWRAYRAPRFRPEIVGAGCAVLFNWILTAISRGSAGEPAASRYVYVGAVFVILVAAEAARGLRPPSMVQAGVVGAATLCVWGNWHLATAGSFGLRQASAVTRAELAAIEWAGDTVEPGMHPDLLRMPIVTAGSYLDTVRSHGSPASSEAEVAALPERDRQIVDDLSLDAVQFEVEPDLRPSSGAAPTLLSGGGLRSGACIELRPGVDPSPAVLTLGSRGVVLHAEGDQQLALSRFADHAASRSEITMPGGTPFAVAVRGDDVARPWRLSIPLTVPVRVCSRP